jgi:transcriptional regulator with XRE-family HTH domain
MYYDMIGALGHKIRKIRELKDLTQGFVADELGISQQAYSKLERGETDVSLENTEKIAEIFGITTAELFSFDERVVFNIMHNQTGIHQNILHQTVTESDYLKEKIAAMEKEIAYLKEIVDLLRVKR